MFQYLKETIRAYQARDPVAQELLAMWKQLGEIAERITNDNEGE